MKKIEAYIQPFMLQKVTDTLHIIHIHGMTVLDARGFGKEKDESYPHHSRESVVDFTPKIKLEIICSDKDAERIVKTIQETVRTGRKGDGKIFMVDIEKVVSVRTGAKNDQAI